MTTSITSQEGAAPLKKSGFVVMVGRSNVGKSTLINALVGSKVAITTPKPQTTRLPVTGILSTDEGQAVFVDTPGLMQKGGDRLTKKLTESIMQSLQDIDVVLYVVDPTRSIAEEEKSVMQLIAPIDKPKILVINKSDLPENEIPFIGYYRDLAKDYAETFEVSALKGHNLEALKDRIFELLPVGEPFYPAGQLTNMPSEQWVAELIREKLFLRLREEVPYSVTVNVETIERRTDNLIYIKAYVLTTDERYKRMIIGKGGQGIKEIGLSSRHELETVMQSKVYIDLTVEVDSHWPDRME